MRFWGRSCARVEVLFRRLAPTGGSAPADRSSAAPTHEECRVRGTCSRPEMPPSAPLNVVRPRAAACPAIQLGVRGRPPAVSARLDRPSGRSLRRVDRAERHKGAAHAAHLRSGGAAEAPRSAKPTPRVAPAGASVGPEDRTERTPRVAPAGASVGPEGRTERTPRVAPAGASVGPEGRTERTPRVAPARASVGPEGRTERTPRVAPAGASVGPEGQTERTPRVAPARASVGPEGRTERSQ